MMYRVPVIPKYRQKSQKVCFYSWGKRADRLHKGDGFSPNFKYGRYCQGEDFGLGNQTH